MRTRTIQSGDQTFRHLTQEVHFNIDADADLIAYVDRLARGHKFSQTVKELLRAALAQQADGKP